MSLSQQRITQLRQEATSALVCLPFLDTEQPKEEAVADQILAERGYSRLAVRILRALAGVGLWYQIIAWEDFHLDLSDVLAGYGVIVAGMGVFILIFSRPWGLGVLSLAAVLMCLAWRGWTQFRRRLIAESQPNKPLQPTRAAQPNGQQAPPRSGPRG
jgi:hypothetical protein